MKDPRTAPTHRSRRSRSVFLLALALAACGLAAASPKPAAAAPTLQFLKEKNRVKAKSVTVGGDVLFFSISGERAEWTRRLVVRLDFIVANSRGIAVNNLANVVDSSIWAAYDFTAGSFTVDSPTHETQSIAMTEDELIQTSGFTYPGERLELVVVRGSHAWHHRVYDGGSTDGGAASDGRVEIPFGAMEYASPSAKLETYDVPRTGDVLIGIDPAAMVYFVVTVGGGKG